MIGLASRQFREPSLRQLRSAEVAGVQRRPQLSHGLGELVGVRQTARRPSNHRRRQDNQYPIPASNTEGNKPGSETFGSGQEFDVADLTIKEEQRGSVGIPTGANGQAIP